MRNVNTHLRGALILKKHNLSKTGEGPGGKFNGPSIKFILREDTLIELEEILTESASPFITYLRSIRALHELCTARLLEDQSSEFLLSV